MNRILACLNVILLVIFTVVGLILSLPKNWRENWYVVNEVSATPVAAAPTADHEVLRSRAGADHSWTPVLAATGKVYYSFIGFDAICLLSQEATRPERNIPLGLFSSLFLVFVLYSGVAVALTGMVPVQVGDVC